jgi:hypothetical protein
MQARNGQGTGLRCAKIAIEMALLLRAGVRMATGGCKRQCHQGGVKRLAL